MSKPVLHRVDDFREALRHYKVSDLGRQKLAETKLALLRAPSAGGRNTIINELVKTGKYESFVTDTTRPPRYNDGVLEQDGVEYWFRSEDDFFEDLSNGLYIEAEIIHGQQVSGMSIRETEKAASHGKVAISDIHFEGVENVVSAKPDTFVIFITPPSFEEWIKRFRGRGQITEEEFQSRFESAEHDYAHALNNDYYRFVINDSYLLSADHIRHIIETNDYPAGVNREAREVSEQVYERIKAELRP